MANVDNGMTPGLGDQPGAPARTRAGKPAGPAFKPMHQDRDPQEYATLLDAYDMSFRNMAEGEVVKGTVLKVTDTAVVVDVGYKSEGLIQLNEFLDESGQVTVQAGDTLSAIAKRYLGDANAYMDIFNINRDQLSDPDKIKPGQVLKIPQHAHKA